MDYNYRGNKISSTTNGSWRFFLTKDMEDFTEFGPFDQAIEAEMEMDRMLEEDSEWLREE